MPTTYVSSTLQEVYEPTYRQFLEAVKSNDVNLCFKLARDDHLDVNLFNGSLLNLAAENGRTEIVRDLLMNPYLRIPNVPTNVVDIVDQFKSPLARAALNGHLATLKVLLNDARFDIRQLCDKMVREAFRKGHICVVNYILDKTFPPEDYNEYQNPLCCAIYSKDEAFISYVIAYLYPGMKSDDSNTRANTTYYRSQYVLYALYRAVHYNYLDIAELLINDVSNPADMVKHLSKTPEMTELINAHL